MIAERTSDPYIDVVAGLILRDGRLLACQRLPSASHPHKWEFPGGKVENGESQADALRREMEEELGVRAQEIRQVLQYRHRYPKGPKVSLSFFSILAYHGELQNRVFQRIRWVGLIDLKGLDFLAGDQLLIDRLAIDGGVQLLGGPLRP